MLWPSLARQHWRLHRVAVAAVVAAAGGQYVLSNMTQSLLRRARDRRSMGTCSMAASNHPDCV